MKTIPIYYSWTNVVYTKTRLKSEPAFFRFVWLLFFKYCSNTHTYINDNYTFKLNKRVWR